jgi:hypothetical protein
MVVSMMVVFTYLPGFVTVLFRGMPGVWRGRHPLLLCWLICTPAPLVDRYGSWQPASRGR